MQTPTSGFLRLPQIVPGIVPVSKSTWWKWCAEGKAPAPIKLGERTTVWRSEDIKAFVESFGGQ
jgi:predicted DNA-binding transcriptional regulator AlpA